MINVRLKGGSLSHICYLLGNVATFPSLYFSLDRLVTISRRFPPSTAIQAGGCNELLRQKWIHSDFMSFGSRLYGDCYIV